MILEIPFKVWRMREFRFELSDGSRPCYFGVRVDISGPREVFRAFYAASGLWKCEGPSKDWRDDLSSAEREGAIRTILVEGMRMRQVHAVRSSD